MNVGSYTDLYQPVITLSGTFFSPSVASAFQGCFPLPSGLFLRRTVPSIVGVENVILSPFVASEVDGIPNFTLYSQKYRYLPLDFFARNPIATGLPPSSLVEMTTLLLSMVAPVRTEAASFPISSMPSESVPLLNSLTISEAPSSA